MQLALELGDSPFILTVPHDGHLSIGTTVRKEYAQWITEGYDPRDIGTTECVRQCRARLSELGQTPTVLRMLCSRSQVDVNRDPERQPLACVTDVVQLAAYKSFHEILAELIRATLTKHGHCLLVDVHSFRYDRWQELDVILGTKAGRTCSPEWTRELRSLLAQVKHPFFERTLGVAESPDEEQGIGWGLSGGYVVRRAAECFQCERDEGRFGALQLECRRQTLETDFAEVIGRGLAEALVKLSL